MSIPKENDEPFMNNNLSDREGKNKDSDENSVNDQSKNETQPLSSKRNMNKQAQKGANRNCCCFHFRITIPLFCCLFLIIGIFVVIIIALIFFINYYFMKSMFDSINNHYFTKEIIDPIINKNANYTEAFNIRIKALDDIYLESKLNNIATMLKFTLKYPKENLTNCMPITENSTSNVNFTFNNTNNYFLHIGNKDKFNTNMKESINMSTYFLENFINKLEYPFGINELMIYETVSKTYLTFCEDWVDNNGFLSGIVNNDKSLKNIIDYSSNLPDYYSNISSHSTDYFGFVVPNKYELDIETRLNYLKFYKFNYEDQDQEITMKFLIILRFNQTSFTDLINKQDFDITSIIPIYDLNSANAQKMITNPEYFFIFGSAFMYNFFVYGTLDLLSYAGNSIAYTNHESLMTYNLSNLTNFYYIIKYLDSNNYYKNLYNSDWKKEFTLMGQIIYSILKTIDYINFDDIDCSKNSKDKILCQMIVDISFYNFSFEKISYNSNSTNSDGQSDFDDITSLSNQMYEKKKFGNAKISLNNSVFENSSTSSTETKILIYSEELDNLKIFNIELLNVVLYASIKQMYSDLISNTEALSQLLLILTTIFIVLLVTCLLLLSEINKTVQNIKRISELKNLLFCKKEIIPSFIKKMNAQNLNFFNTNINDADILSNDKESENLSRGSIDINNSKISDLENNTDNNINNLNINRKIRNVKSINDFRKSLRRSNNTKYDINNTESNTSFASANSEESTNDNIDNELKRWNKENIYDDYFFTDCNKIIITYTYMHLLKILKNIDNFNNKKFNDKLKFLRGKYKLSKEKEGKFDCQLSNDIYQALSKIDFVNLNDVAYNVHFNYNYAVNQSFNMFRNILEMAENKKFIPLKNNKFINFQDILKIIYFIKREKIHILVKNIYSLNQENKADTITNKITEDSNLTNININNIANNNMNKINIMTKKFSKNNKGNNEDEDDDVFADKGVKPTNLNNLNKLYTLFPDNSSPSPILNDDDEEENFDSNDEMKEDEKIKFNYDFIGKEKEKENGNGKNKDKNKDKSKNKNKNKNEDDVINTDDINKNVGQKQLLKDALKFDKDEKIIFREEDIIDNFNTNQYDSNNNIEDKKDEPKKQEEDNDNDNSCEVNSEEDKKDLFKDEEHKKPLKFDFNNREGKKEIPPYKSKIKDEEELEEQKGEDKKEEVKNESNKEKGEENKKNSSIEPQHDQENKNSNKSSDKSNKETDDKFNFSIGEYFKEDKKEDTNNKAKPIKILNFSRVNDSNDSIKILCNKFNQSKEKENKNKNNNDVNINSAKNININENADNMSIKSNKKFQENIDDQYNKDLDNKDNQSIREILDSIKEIDDKKNKVNESKTKNKTSDLDKKIKKEYKDDENKKSKRSKSKKNKKENEKKEKKKNSGDFFLNVQAEINKKNENPNPNPNPNDNIVYNNDSFRNDNINNNSGNANQNPIMQNNNSNLSFS